MSRRTGLRAARRDVAEGCAGAVLAVVDVPRARGWRQALASVCAVVLKPAVGLADALADVAAGCATFRCGCESARGSRKGTTVGDSNRGHRLFAEVREDGEADFDDVDDADDDDKSGARFHRERRRRQQRDADFFAEEKARRRRALPSLPDGAGPRRRLAPYTFTHTHTTAPPLSSLSLELGSSYSRECGRFSLSLSTFS